MSISFPLLYSTMIPFKYYFFSVTPVAFLLIVRKRFVLYTLRESTISSDDQSTFGHPVLLSVFPCIIPSPFIPPRLFLSLNNWNAIVCVGAFASARYPFSSHLIRILNSTIYAILFGCVCCHIHGTIHLARIPMYYPFVHLSFCFQAS